MKNELVKFAREFAKQAHEGQTRWDGSDYFENHVEPVAQYVSDNLHDLFPSECWKGWFMPDLVNATVAAAYLHDVKEDTNFPLDDFPPLVQDIVDALTKKEGENYLEYIQRIIESGPCSVAARAIKLADLRHNMSDLKEGSMKDKYRFAEEMISSHLRSIHFSAEWHLNEALNLTGPNFIIKFAENLKRRC